MSIGAGAMVPVQMVVKIEEGATPYVVYHGNVVANGFARRGNSRVPG